MSTPPEAVPPAGTSLGTYLVPLRRSTGWLLAVGIALVVLGTLGLGAAGLLSVASAVWFGFMMAVAGIIVFADAFRTQGWKSRVFHLIIGVLYLAAGLLTFLYPLAATVSLTLFIGAALAASGVMRVIIAIQSRELPVWRWILVSGLLSLLLGVLILMQWPASSLWVLGTFLSIELIFHGFGVIALSRAIRSTFDGVTPRKS